MSHSFTSLTYHVVFSTKYRVPWITDEFEGRLYRFIGGVIRNRGGHLLAVGGVGDHIHLLMRKPGQKAHHRSTSYETEVRELARKHGLEVEDRFLAGAG